MIALEEIKGALSCVFTADTGKDAAIKKEIINAIFGTHSWTAVEDMGIEALEWGMRVAVKMKHLAITHRPEDRDALLRLVEQAKDEVRDELAPSLGKGSAPTFEDEEELEVETAEMPF